jgi:hypothetical protein
MNAPLGMNRRAFLAQTIFSGDRRLLPHQVEQAVFAVERERSLNASDTGTGKFLVAMGMRRLLEHEAGRIERCLYTCPKTALGQFQQEFVDHGYKTFVLRHGHDVIPTDADTVLVANSTMLVTHRGQLRGWSPPLVVLDEAAAFKTATAARTRAVYGDALDCAGGIIDGVRFVLAMSGTLAPAHNGELFPHCVHSRRRRSSTSAVKSCAATSLRRSSASLVYVASPAAARNMSSSDRATPACYASGLTPMPRTPPCARSLRHYLRSDTSWCRSTART